MPFSCIKGSSLPRPLNLVQSVVSLLADMPLSQELKGLGALQG